jgi:hypothetical protein
MFFSQYIKVFKSWFLKGSIKSPVPNTRKLTDFKLDYADPEGFKRLIRIGENLDNAIDVLSQFNYHLNERRRHPILLLSEISNFEWYTSKHTDSDDFLQQILLYDELLNESMGLIDGVAEESYYRVNRRFFDGIYPVLIEELVGLRRRYLFS